jgi:hypothetical protein
MNIVNSAPFHAALSTFVTILCLPREKFPAENIILLTIVLSTIRDLNTLPNCYYEYQEP